MHGEEQRRPKKVRVRRDLVRRRAGFGCAPLREKGLVRGPGAEGLSGPGHLTPFSTSDENWDSPVTTTDRDGLVAPL